MGMCFLILVCDVAFLFVISALSGFFSLFVDAAAYFSFSFFFFFLLIFNGLCYVFGDVLLLTWGDIQPAVMKIWIHTRVIWRDKNEDKKALIYKYPKIDKHAI